MRLIICLLYVLSVSVNAQVIRGAVFDRQNGEPLPYANLGIKNKGVGGIADGTGKFSIDFSKASESDSLIISYVGYRSLQVLISSFTVDKPQSFYLQPAPKLLDEVVVLAKQEVIVLGNDNKSRMHSGWGDFGSARGRAFGLLIKAPEIPVKINKVIFHLHDNEFDSVRLRINLLEVENKTASAAASQTKSLFITTSKQGWIEVPIIESIILRTEIVVAIEWVDAWAKPRTLKEGGSYVFTLSLGHYDGQFYRREKPEESLVLTSAKLCPSIYLESVAVKK